jgi:4-hydroxymandelate oxidase
VDHESLEAAAREVMSPAAYHYVAGGSDDEITVAENTAAWRRVRLLPHVLNDVSTVSHAATLLGADMTAPVLVAPMATQRLAHDEGEKAMARGAARAGTVMVVSTMATATLEDIAAAAPGGTLWFQFYVHRDRGLSEDLVRRAEAAGYEAVVLTVDVPVLSNRRREAEHHFQLPDGMTVANLDTSLESVEGSGLAEYTNAAFDPGLTPDDIGWIKSIVDLPVVVKGVLRADDAVRATDAGADAVIVSNHGGRQMDGAIASADALPAVVEAVGGNVPVLVDGGIRGGNDVFKALALGASAVLVGRPLYWALAAGGEDGVAGYLEEIHTELARAMALCGVADLSEIDSSLIAS